MGYQNLLYAAADGVATVTVNRPDKYNALNRPTIAELEQCITEIERDAEVRAVIITGAGEKAFVAGADINELASLDPVAARAHAARGQRLFARIENLGKPVIAAINGFALGGGLELAMACSIRVASENARLGQPEVKLGIIPGYGGTQRLPRLVGKGAALALLLTGDPISAQEAHRIGLVEQVVPPAELLPAARQWAAKMLANGPLALSLCLAAVHAGFEMPLDEAMAFEAAQFGLSCATEDMREGTRAFLEKRKAEFRGR
ncbi:MAG TPA: enoyl-CoA hydratase-related protein [Bryobacterales bacterium]|nr:enoyl-CoA hydratase-related protein [Bryobacterales bacterium]